MVAAGQRAEEGQAQGVGGREDDTAVVDVASERGWRAEERELPFEEVGRR